MKLCFALKMYHLPCTVGDIMLEYHTLALCYGTPCRWLISVAEVRQSNDLGMLYLFGRRIKCLT
jgi:hypothetical protein